MLCYFIICYYMLLYYMLFYYMLLYLIHIFFPDTMIIFRTYQNRNDRYNLFERYEINITCINVISMLR